MGTLWIAIGLSGVALAAGAVRWPVRRWRHRRRYGWRLTERKQQALHICSSPHFVAWHRELAASGITVHAVTSRFLRETRRRSTEGDTQ